MHYVIKSHSPERLTDGLTSLQGNCHHQENAETEQAMLEGQTDRKTESNVAWLGWVEKRLFSEPHRPRQNPNLPLAFHLDSLTHLERMNQIGKSQLVPQWLLLQEGVEDGKLQGKDEDEHQVHHGQVDQESVTHKKGYHLLLVCAL